MNTTLLALTATTGPLVSCFLALVVFRRRPSLAIGAALLGLGAAAAAALALLQSAGPPDHQLLMPWLDSEESRGMPLMFGFLLDGTNLIVGAMVACIALLVAIYSIGYMADDPGKSRYFGMLSLFAWSMLSFVYAANLLQMFVFWELVGLASFLLIGFWYEKPAAAAAARKAFIMTRVGDVGMFVGLILLLQSAGSLEVLELCSSATIAALPQGRLDLIALLLFSGIVGKSAQFPLHTWLPDAMEGPTPVSALLHSATMVAAGVFLFARFHPLLVASTVLVQVALPIAAFTALLSATVAMVQRDIKRVLAYSSISQLAFMLAGLAAGGLHAGLFHLITHAFFKALLFLCAGAYIHHYHSNDMVVIGRAGGRNMHWTTAGLIVGGGALAGIPPLAGFFSKEGILAAVGGLSSPAPLIALYLASFLTAYYTARMVFLVTRPNPASGLASLEELPQKPAREAPLSMRLPLMILTLASIAAGFAAKRIAALIDAPEQHPSAMMIGSAIATAALAVALAWFEYGRKQATQRSFVERMPTLHRLFLRQWYIDEIYRATFGKLVAALSGLARLFEDQIVDGTADKIGRATVVSGRAAAQTQLGAFQVYVGSAVIALAIFAYFLGR